MSDAQKTNEPKQPHKASREKQQPINQAPVNQKQPIPQNVLKRAIEDPQTTRPEVILQLQRVIGNRAVGQLLAGVTPPQLADHHNVIP